MTRDEVSWRVVADVLAERLSHHAYCDNHPITDPDPCCPFCRDRAAYQRWVTKTEHRGSRPTPCADCAVDTAPCTGRRGCRHTRRWEWYMVHDQVWAAAGMTGDGGYLCVACLERRLGRRLRPEDFTGAPVNDPDPWDTPRLVARKHGTRL